MSRVENKLFHYCSKAIADYHMIHSGDRVMVCLSGGKDSFTLLSLLKRLQVENKYRFELFSYTLDQSQPGWNDVALRKWLETRGINYEVEKRDTYSVVKEKIPAGKTYCSLCSRLRRGNIYRYARENGFKKVALGHHRDDLIETLMMSICYNGQIRSMPPKLLTDSREQIVIRPLAYCQEADIIEYAKEQGFPIIPCNLCGAQKNLTRVKVKKMLAVMRAENPKVPSNMLHALSSVRLSQLMDRSQWDFEHLEDKMVET